VRVASALVWLLALVALLSGCTRPALGVENTWTRGVVVRVTGADGRIGTWWAAPGSSGRAEAEAWPGLEPVRVELLLDDGACTPIYQAEAPAQVYLVEPDGTVSEGSRLSDEAALPVTSRCAGDP
jgi:hypothetical protein